MISPDDEGEAESSVLSMESPTRCHAKNNAVAAAAVEAVEAALESAATADAAPPDNPLLTIMTILSWYTMSNVIILLTKWLFSNYFSYPLTVTVYSNSIASLWALLLSRHSKWRITKPSQRQFRHFIIPIGITMGLEIGSTNLALKLLTVSFGTILKGGGPIFTFLWGYLFGVESFSCHILGCLLVIATGIVLATLGEGDTDFQLVGFCLQLFGSCLGGLRWAMTHKILQDHKNNNNNQHYAAATNSDGSNGSSSNDYQSTTTTTFSPESHALSPLAATLYMSPITAICILPFALALEGKLVWQQMMTSYASDIDNNTTIDDSDGDPTYGLLIIITMTIVASLVFCLLMSEYWLVKATYSLALSVAGVFKELLTIGGGIFFFSETINWRNVVGFVTCQAGIMSYVCLRYNPPEKAYKPISEDTAALTGPQEKEQQQEMFHDEIMNEEVELPMYKDDGNPYHIATNDSVTQSSFY